MISDLVNYLNNNLQSVFNLNTLAHISLLAVAVAVAAATMPGSQSYKKLKSIELPDIFISIPVFGRRFWTYASFAMP